MFHTEKQILGKGYIKAYEFERETTLTLIDNEQNEIRKGSPFIEIDRGVYNWIIKNENRCLKDVLERLTVCKKDICAIFPVKTLKHSFGINADTNTEHEKGEVDKLIIMLQDFQGLVLKYANLNDDRVKRKVDEYLKVIDLQIEENEKTKPMIDILDSPFPSR